MLHACSFTICLVFCYTSWHFYAFSRTNLLTRCHSASSLFSAIFVFQKSYIGNILRIGRNKSRTSYFYRSFQKTEDDTERSQRMATPQGGTAQPLAAPTHGEPTWSTSWRRPFSYKDPSLGKIEGTDRFSHKQLQAAAVIESRSGGSRSSSRHPAREGNPCRRPSTPPWSPPEWCVSSLPWTMGP
jgi:hypothetical protein